MKTVKVYLPGTREVQAFVSALLPLQGDFELYSDEIILDARSLMGIFSFDLSKPIDLRIEQDTEQTMEALKPFIQEGE